MNRSCSYVESELREHADLADRVNWHRELRIKMREYDERQMKAELKGYYPRMSSEEIDDLSNIRSLSGKSNRIQTILAIAATVLLLVTAGWFFLDPSEQGDLFASNFEPYPMLIVERGGDEDPGEEVPLTQAIAAYEEGRYGDAASAFNEIDKTPVQFLYQGVSFLCQ